MPDLTTRDVFEQLNTRLTRVEDDLRTLRSEMNERIAELRQEIRTGFREVGTHFRWIVGIMLTTWLTMMVAIWLK
ncbi:MAG: hypothetical protein HN712_02985 [Gemmatimonadetes bacterium]|jgi:hypothetical protein|nr:hypothetical protein [Gemmatimonadota bacterium]